MDLGIFGFILKNWYIKVMGLLDKAKSKVTEDDVNFSKDELQFLQAKLRTADYKGNEFEKFYTVYVKIQNQLDILK
jgi:hypothetical protein